MDYQIHTNFKYRKLDRLEYQNYTERESRFVAVLLPAVRHDLRNGHPRSWSTQESLKGQFIWTKHCGGLARPNMSITSPIHCSRSSREDQKNAVESVWLCSLVLNDTLSRMDPKMVNCVSITSVLHEDACEGRCSGQKAGLGVQSAGEVTSGLELFSGCQRLSRRSNRTGVISHIGYMYHGARSKQHDASRLTGFILNIMCLPRLVSTVNSP